MSFEHLDRDTNEKPPSSAESGRTGPSVALIALLVVAAAALSFVLQNGHDVRTHFLFFTRTSKLWATIGIAILIGAILDRLFSVWWKRRKQSKN